MVAHLRHPAAPFVAPLSGDINQRLAQVADALNRKADANGASVFPMIGLSSPDGTTWKLSVDNTGALSIVAVPRP
jgi:hypothetical protein